MKYQVDSRFVKYSIGKNCENEDTFTILAVEYLDLRVGMPILSKKLALKVKYEQYNTEASVAKIKT